MSDGSKKPDDKSKSSSFVGMDGTGSSSKSEVPTISTLLGRKKVDISELSRQLQAPLKVPPAAGKPAKAPPSPPKADLAPPPPAAPPPFKSPSGLTGTHTAPVVSGMPPVPDMNAPSAPIQLASIAPDSAGLSITGLEPPPGFAMTKTSNYQPPRDPGLPDMPDAPISLAPVILEPFSDNGEKSEFIPNLTLGEAVPEFGGAAKPKAVVAKRRVNLAAVSPLIIWTPAQLKNGSDPLGLGLSLLVSKGADCAVFLAIAPPAPGSQIPQFTAASALNPGARQPLWTGLKWNVALNPDVWNQFIKTGWVELAPPQTMTNQQSARNVLRGAFGIVTNEYLLMIRCGPANACRGLIAIVSPRTLVPDMSEALKLISQPIKGPSAKAA